LTTDSAALLILERLNTPRALTAAILLREKEFEQLVRLQINPVSDYRDSPFGAEKFRKDYLATSLLSKLDREIGIDKRSAGIQKWKDAEERNLFTNRRLRHLSVPLRARWLNHLWLAKEICSGILGEFNVIEFLSHPGFGPGASRQTPSSRCDRASKHSVMPGVSPRFLDGASHIVGDNPLLFESITGLKPDGPCCLLGIEADDEVTVQFVPKNAKTFRAIGVEPLFSVYMQKSVGQMIRKRLRKVHVDLDDQTVNQNGAFIGSVTGQLATIDLSSASDTVSKMIVEELLPYDWWDVCDRLRTRFSRLDNEVIEHEKFSSMGNGFTFELESLLFYCLAKATEILTRPPGDNPVRVRVYGDDIIVPTRAAEELLSLLDYCGFIPNQDKTFVTGPFRESCGKDFFLGFDVRPFFIKRELRGPEDYYLLYNQCRKWGLPRSLLSRIYTSLSKEFRYRVPAEHGRLDDDLQWVPDTGFHSFFDEALPHLVRYPARKGWGGYRFPYWGVVSATVVRRSVGLLIVRLQDLERLEESKRLGKPLRAGGNDLSIRSRNTRRRTQSGYVLDWR